MPTTTTTDLTPPRLPAFDLLDVVSGHHVTAGATQARGPRGVLVMLFANHCPYVVHVLDAAVAVGHEAEELGLATVAISASSTRTHPEDGPVAMKELALARGFGFPYLFDETQEIARAFGAACTPDFWVFDAAGALVYHGRLDAARPRGPVPPSGDALRAAVRAVAEGRAPEGPFEPSVGCSVKWHP